MESSKIARKIPLRKGAAVVFVVGTLLCLSGLVITPSEAGYSENSRGNYWRWDESGSYYFDSALYNRNRDIGIKVLWAAMLMIVSGSVLLVLSRLYEAQSRKGQ